MIAHSRPTTGPEEAEAVARVLASGHHARGPETAGFEAELAATVGLAHAHATSSGTTALQLALLGLGVKRGHAVLIPSLTCAAVMNAVRATGAEVALYDGDYWMAARGWARGKVGAAVKAVVVVAPPDRGVSDDDVRGMIADSGEAGSLARVPVVLDRCQQLAPVSAHGRGAGGIAACEVFSFYATKCISTGGGGAVATNDAALMARIVDLNSHDKRESYEAVRYNFQFDDIRAAVGRVQIGRLAEFVEKRERLAGVYRKALGGGAGGEGGGIAFRFLYDCGDEAGCDRVEQELGRAGIEAKRPVYRPLHRYLGLSDADFPLATSAWGRWLSLPIYPTLSEDDARRVAAAAASGAGQ